MIALLLMLMTPAAQKANAPAIDTAWSVLNYGVADTNSGRRAQAVRALGLLKGNRHAAELAEKALGDSNTDVRAEAAITLGRLHVASAIPKLRRALDDQQIKVVVSAADALYEFKDPPAFDVFYAMLTGERKSTQSLLQSQMAVLRDPKAVEKLAFETGIGFVPFGSMGYEAWKLLTRNDSSVVKAAAALKLADDPDPKSGQALVDACDDDNWQIRAAAAEAIAKRGDLTLLHALTPMLHDSTDAVRYQSAASLIFLSQHPHKIRRLRH